MFVLYVLLKVKTTFILIDTYFYKNYVDIYSIE